MAESPTPTAGTDTRNRLVRYGITALILLVIGGLFVQREILTDDTESVSAQDTAVELGLLDDRSVKLGQPAPDFALLDLSGNVVRLSDFLGKTVVLKHGSDFELVATNELDDGFDASPAIVGDVLYLRGRKNLYCIARD